MSSHVAPLAHLASRAAIEHILAERRAAEPDIYLVRPAPSSDEAIRAAIARLDALTAKHLTEPPVELSEPLDLVQLSELPRDAQGRFTPAGALAAADALQDRLDRDYPQPEIDRLSRVAAEVVSGKSVPAAPTGLSDADEAEVARLAKVAARLVEEPAASKSPTSADDEAEVARLAKVAGELR